MKRLVCHLSRLVFAICYLTILIYSQSGYAIVEKISYEDAETGRTYLRLHFRNEIVNIKVAQEFAAIINNTSAPVGDLVFDNVTFESREAITAIAQTLHDNPTIRFFSLINNTYLNEADRQILFEVLPTIRQLTYFYVMDGFGDQYMPLIANILKSDECFLTSLCLSGNKISDKGIENLSDALKINGSLVHLELVNNSLTDEGAAAIAEALKKNIKLKKLSIAYNNEISQVGELAIIKSLLTDNLTLTSLATGNQLRSTDWIITHIQRRNELLGCIKEKVGEVMQDKISLHTTTNELAFIANSTGEEIRKITALEEKELKAIEKIRNLQDAIKSRVSELTKSSKGTYENITPPSSISPLQIGSQSPSLVGNIKQAAK